MPWLTIAIEFLKILAEGGFKSAWQGLKEKWARDDENDVIGMSDSELDKRVRDEITRK